MLPKLTHEEVEALIKFINDIDFYNEVSYDEFCCTSDAVDSTTNIICNYLKKQYGMDYYLWFEQEKEDGEDFEEEE